MPAVKREVLDVLRYELNFLEQGGYTRVRKLGLPVSIFQDSLTCLNHGDPLRPHACRECPLAEFVPPDRATEDVPCHFIPLDAQGRSIDNISNPQQKLDCVRNWLQSTISKLQQGRGEVTG